MPRSSDPRLVTRFALGGLVAFLAVGGALAFLVSDQLRTSQEQAATYHAVFVTDAILSHELTPADLLQPVEPDGARYEQLSVFVHARVLLPPVVRVKVWRADGTVLFSDEPRLVGRNFGRDDDLIEAFEGKVEAGVSDLGAAENVFERDRFTKLFETYVPLYLGGDRAGPRADAVAELYTDYNGIQQPVDRLFKTLVATLAVGLFVLYLLLLPIIRRAARTLSEQNAQLEDHAERLRSLLEREQQTVADLRELNRLKDEFVAIASHEVRTPLTSIIGYAKTLRRPEFAGDAAARDEFTKAIERQGERLSRLVDNLLTTAHMEADRSRLDLAPVSLVDVVDDVLAGLGPGATHVEVTIPEALPMPVTDRHRLELIVSNLLDNALKFSPAGSRCEFGARQAGENIQIWITDRGVGIDPSHQALIFDRFYQVDSSVTRRYGGVGLGLHLVRELVQSLGGTISVESALGQGSTFTVTLPIAGPGSGNGHRTGDERLGAGVSA